MIYDEWEKFSNIIIHQPKRTKELIKLNIIKIKYSHSDIAYSFSLGKNYVLSVPTLVEALYDDIEQYL